MHGRLAQAVWPSIPCPLHSLRSRVGVDRQPVSLRRVPYAPAVGVSRTKGNAMTNKCANEIALLNDLCRTAMGVAGRLYQTPGISALPCADQSAIREKVEAFDTFTPDNDPHQEHDFGAFEHNGERIFWKIDYYAPDLEHGSENPADPAQTVRVLTIMLATEY